MKGIPDDDQVSVITEDEFLHEPRRLGWKVVVEAPPPVEESSVSSVYTTPSAYNEPVHMVKILDVGDESTKSTKTEDDICCCGIGDVICP